MLLKRHRRSPLILNYYFKNTVTCILGLINAIIIKLRYQLIIHQLIKLHSIIKNIGNTLKEIKVIQAKDQTKSLIAFK